MSQNRRKRSRNRNRATTGDVRTQTPQKPPQQKRNEPKIDPVEFWGDPAALPEPIRTIDERVEEVVAGKRQIADITLPKSSSIGDLDAEQLQQALGIDTSQLLEMGSDDVVEVTA